ncbi:linoleate diol synthase [Meredithblackwellia eburnea MCA 4105]
MAAGNEAPFITTHPDQTTTIPPSTSSNNARSSIFGTVRQTVAGVWDLGHAVLTPPPRTPDGLSNEDAAAPSDTPRSLDLLRTLILQVKEGTLITDAKTLAHGLSQISEPLDDRKLLLEEVVTMLGSLPANSVVGTSLSDALIKLLWDDLPHPPASYIGTGVVPDKTHPDYVHDEYKGRFDKHGHVRQGAPTRLPQAPEDVQIPKYYGGGKFRAADGGGNNPTNIDLGRAGTPYARSVAPIHPAPKNLPDPGVVFDALLKRETFEPHPSGISSLLFSFATIIIHSCFQTSRNDPTINETSSYLDLAPLYGKDEEEQKTIRTFDQGELWPDTFASDRLGLMPPHVAALLVVFNRNHNFITKRLFQLNETNKYKPVESLDQKGKYAQDEDLFQTARLINCGFFVNVVFYDYIRVILNQNRTKSTWALFPNSTIKSVLLGNVARGVGNSCSVEFNCLYRWHSAISAADEKWTSDLLTRLIPGKSFDEMNERDFGMAYVTLMNEQGNDVRNWTFGGLQRNEKGYFKDVELAKILQDATDEVAGAFRAHGSPACMRMIDVLGIAISRNTWQCCSLNEFRKFLNLQPYTSFSEWNPDPRVWKVAEQLYSHIDNLELFPGLQAEERKPSQTGSGLAPGYTISRAILSDAVALVRGDRYFTTDFNAACLTNWGFQDVQPPYTSGAFGGIIGKLLMRTMPTCYTFNSIYALFPFSTPGTTKKILTELNLIDQYDFTKPTVAPAWHPAFTYKGCIDILSDHRRFGVIYAKSICEIVGTPYGFFINFDEIMKHARDRDLMDAALFPFGYEVQIKEFYEKITYQLLREKSWSYDNGTTFNVDVVRDVTTLASVYWVANTFGIPLKTEKSKFGVLTPQQLYLMLTAFFTYVFMNFDPSAGFNLRDAAISHSKILGGIISLRFSQVTGIPAVVDYLAREIQDAFHGKNANQIVMSDDARSFYKRLLESKRPLEELNASAQSIMTASTSNQGEVAAHVINFYLKDENKVHYDAIVKLAHQDSVESDALLWKYILEVMRLDPQVAGIPRYANADGSFVDGDNTVEFKKGDIIFPSMYYCNKDPTVFPNPDVVDVTRDEGIYRVFGAGIHNCLGSKLVKISMVAMIREVFKLKNLRRAPGPAGQLYRFTEHIADTPVEIYMSAQATIFPFPQNLSVVYDKDIYD